MNTTTRSLWSSPTSTPQFFLVALIRTPKDCRLPQCRSTRPRVLVSSAASYTLPGRASWHNFRAKRKRLVRSSRKPPPGRSSRPGVAVAAVRSRPAKICRRASACMSARAAASRLSESELERHRETIDTGCVLEVTPPPESPAHAVGSRAQLR